MPLAIISRFLIVIVIILSSVNIFDHNTLFAECNSFGPDYLSSYIDTKNQRLLTPNSSLSHDISSSNHRKHRSSNKFDIDKEHGPIVNASICPCTSTRSRAPLISLPSTIHICFLNNSLVNDIVSMNQSPRSDTQYQVISSLYGIKQDQMSDCDLIVELIHAQPEHQHCSHKYVCPESCLPKPFIVIPVNWLLDARIWSHDNNNLASTIAITCSMTIQDIIDQHHVSLQSSTFITDVMRIIALRRYIECHEQEYWPKHASHSKRKVFGLIIWIGSRSRLDMATTQIKVLQDQHRYDADHYVAGWIATEEQYPCLPRSTRCSSYQHHTPNFTELLKYSEINEESSGWSCAQRRPLRALAHTLSLYEPQFIFLVDDDTYVNATFFTSTTSSLTPYIRSYLSQHRTVIGFLETKHRLTGGRITKRGILYGGRGYLLGSAVLASLQSNIVYGPTAEEDAFRDPRMMKHLSILREAYTLTSYENHTCHDGHQCLKIINNDDRWSNYGAIGKFNARLVDICANMMSDEHTCYHSDHALTRCLAHGVYADLIHIGCENSSLGMTSYDDPNRIIIRTCGYNARKLDHMLSCHRFIYNRSDLSNKERAYHGKKIKLRSHELLQHQWC